jgi:hypothetical protein
VTPAAVPGARPSAEGQARTVRPALVLCAAIAMVASGCSHHPHDARAVGHLVVSGDAEVAVGNGPFRPVHHSATLRSGDRVHLSSGAASIHMVPDGLLELRPDTQLRMDSPPFLETGDLLVEPSQHALSIGTDQAAAQVPDGVTRMTRGLSLTVKSYVSTSALEAPGRPALAIRAPRQATVTDRDLLPARAVPIAYEDGDAWDHRFLARAEALGQQLETDTKSFPQQLARGQGHTPGFYKLMYPQLDRQPGFADVFEQVENQSVIDSPNPVKLGTPTSYLIASAIALEGKQGTFADRWTGEFKFLGDEVLARGGTDWGLIAYDQGVDSTTPVTDDVLAAMGRAPLIFTLPLGQRALALGAPGPTPTTGSATTPTTKAAPTRPRPTTPPPTTPPPSPTSVPSAPSTGIAPVDKLVDPLVDPLINTLNNGLNPPPPNKSILILPTPITISP